MKQDYTFLIGKVFFSVHSLSSSSHSSLLRFRISMSTIEFNMHMRCQNFFSFHQNLNKSIFKLDVPCMVCNFDRNSILAGTWHAKQVLF